MDPSRKTCGQRIKAFREYLNMSLSDLASETELSEETLRNIENGAIEPSILQLALIASVYCLPAEELRGKDTIADRVVIFPFCGNKDQEPSEEFVEYPLFAHGVNQRLDQLNIKS